MYASGVHEMQVKQIENILRAKSGVPQNQLCLVIPLSYHDSDSDNLQNVSSNSKFGDFILIFFTGFWYQQRNCSPWISSLICVMQNRLCLDKSED